MTLVDSIMQYAASDKLDGDAWNTLVRVSMEYSIGELPDVLKNTENEFKERTGHTSLPSRWRSAKSVLLKARNNLVTLVDDNGQVLGKSAVERMCKGVTEVVPFDPYAAADTLVASLKELIENYKGMTPEGALRTHILTAMKGL